MTAELREAPRRSAGRGQELGKICKSTVLAAVELLP